MPDAPAHLPDISDLEDARRQIAKAAVVTPLIENPWLNRKLGFRLLLKAEVMQRTGSFKFRGAYNRISRLSEDERKRGVVAFSSGNHAQAVAAAAQLNGTKAVIVMPLDAPTIKVANTRGYGAEVVQYDRYTEDREAIGRRIAAERGSILVPPYEDRHVIAGQGTLGLEIAEQAQALGVVPDAVVCNTSGGGLTAGVALAISARLPKTAIFACEPDNLDDTRRSLEGGTRVANAPNVRSICDALMTEIPGEMTFAINRRLLKGALVVTEAEILTAMATAFRDLKVVIEPGGAVSFAAALAGRVPGKPACVVAIASGGNVDPAIFARAITGH